MNLFNTQDAKLFQLLAEVRDTDPIAYVLAVEYFSYSSLNASLSKLVSTELVSFSENKVFINDDKKLLLFDMNFVKKEEYPVVLVERLNGTVDKSNITSTLTIVSNEWYQKVKPISDKVRKSFELIDKPSTVKFDVCFYLLALVATFFAGMFLGFVFAKSILATLNLFPVILSASGMIYFSQKKKLIEAKRPVNLYSFFSSPLIITFVLNVLITLASLVFSILYHYLYFFVVIVELFVLSYLIAKIGVYSTKNLKGKIKTSLFYSKVFNERLFIGGVNVLDDANRVKQEGVTATLLAPFTKSVLFVSNEVFKAEVLGCPVFYAVATSGHSKVIYLIRKQDYLATNYLYCSNDFTLNEEPSQLLITELENEEKSKDYQYSSDGLIRGSVCQMNDSFVVKFETARLLDKILDTENVSEELFGTEEYILSLDLSLAWSEIFIVKFDEVFFAEQYLKQVIGEISYQNFLVSR